MKQFMVRAKTILKGFYKLFKFFGMKMMNLVNYIILIPAYLIGIGLISIIGKIFRKNFLTKPNQKSYWVEYNRKDSSVEDHYKLF